MPQLSAPNDIIDVFRIVLFGVCLYSTFALVVRYQNGGENWNIKTKDYWFALLMWAFAGCVFTVQGIALDRPLTPGFVLMAAAILTMSKAVSRKGPWGSDAS